MDRLVLAASFLLLWCGVTSFTSKKLVPLIPRPVLYDEHLSNSLRTEVSLDVSTSQLIVTLIFQPPGDCVHGEDRYNYSISLWTPSARYPDHIGPYYGPTATCNGPMKIPMRGLSRDSVYTASLVAYNSARSLKTQKVKFYTTDVQRVVVEKGDHYMKVFCWFAEGSEAKGCHVHIDTVNSYTNAAIDKKMYNITQNHSRLVGVMCVDVEPGASTERVKVYDWKQGGIIGLTPLSPEFVKGTENECPLMGSREDIEIKKRFVVISLTAVTMLVSILIILSGILCKLGKLHSHFLKLDSYTTLTQDNAKATA